MVFFLLLASLPCAVFATAFPTTGGGSGATGFPSPTGTSAARAGTPTESGVMRPLSQYGQIQNVQSYSSNPFYSPTSPYNQRFPVPVYVQGTEMNAGECRNVVASVIAMHCTAQNNCAGKRLADIRPGVMQTLSTMPGQNYMAACSGFIDEVFGEYMAQSQNMLAANATAFPTSFPNAGASAGNALRKDFEIENPYPYRPTTAKVEYLGRMDELNALQAQNAESTQLVATQMPGTFQDLSFTERNQILAAGYAQWQCDPATGRNCAYQPIRVETDQERYEREANEAKAIQQKVTAETEAQKAIANAEDEVLRLTKPCEWGKKHPNERYKDLAATVNSFNEELRKAACDEMKNSGVSSVKKDGWQTVVQSDCGWDQGPSQSKTFTMRDCNLSNEEQMERDPCGFCKANITACEDILDKRNQKIRSDACAGNQTGTIRVNLWFIDEATKCPQRKADNSDSVYCGSGTSNTLRPECTNNTQCPNDQVCRNGVCVGSTICPQNSDTDSSCLSPSPGGTPRGCTTTIGCRCNTGFETTVNSTGCGLDPWAEWVRQLRGQS